MEKYPSFIVDTFTNIRFTGNPAAVCLIPKTLTDKEYQKIAAEFNLSETAFPLPIEGSSQDFKNCSRFSLRWFTPLTEMPLCGHATLATSHVLFNKVGNVNNQIKFETRSGVLTVKKGSNGDVEMDLPKYQISSVKFAHTENPLHGLFPEFAAPAAWFDVVKSVVPAEMNIESVAYTSEGKKLIVTVDPLTTKFEFESVQPDYQKMLELHDGSSFDLLAITVKPKNPALQGFIDASKEEFDYACRCFAPWLGVKEDPVTGSFQCALGPLWSEKLRKNKLYASQCFPNRGGQFRVNVQGNRVLLAGSAVTVINGQISLDTSTPE